MRDLTGMKFGKLTVIKFHGRLGKLKVAAWECLCECGIISVKLASKLKSGRVKSCGCSMGVFKHGDAVRSDISVEYSTWKNIKNRCSNGSNILYGGRGIKVCDRWIDSFENFLTDMGRRPTSNHSIDRFPDNDGNYELGNCRWATPAEQSRNRRSNTKLEYKGENFILSDWAKLLHIPKTSLGWHIKQGRTISDVIQIKKIMYPSINYSFGFIS